MDKENEERIHVAAKALGTDGCSDSPEFFYHTCCEEHDIAYRTGKDEDGVPISRADADKQLFRCMREAGKTPIIGTHVLPAIYWTAVRLFGGKSWKG